jgi:hypothetical protein
MHNETSAVPIAPQHCQSVLCPSTTITWSAIRFALFTASAISGASFQAGMMIVRNGMAREIGQQTKIATSQWEILFANRSVRLKQYQVRAIENELHQFNAAQFLGPGWRAGIITKGESSWHKE